MSGRDLLAGFIAGRWRGGLGAAPRITLVVGAVTFGLSWRLLHTSAVIVFAAVLAAVILAAVIIEARPVKALHRDITNSTEAFASDERPATVTSLDGRQRPATQPACHRRRFRR